jgi:hypothetical protein
MPTGFSAAEKSWLLDYIGANYFVALWTAIKNSHIVVLLMTAGLWSTAIVGIVSSSLFQLQDIPYDNTANFNLTRTLNRSSYDPSILVDDSYLNSYLGRRFLGLALPQWTTPERIVMEGFNQSSPGATSATLIATTRGFAANLSCTSAVVDGGSVMVDPGKRIPSKVSTDLQKKSLPTISPPIGGDPGQDPGDPPKWVINSTIQTQSSVAVNAGVNFNLQSDLFLGWGPAALDWETCDCDPWFSLAGHGQTLNATDFMNPEILANATTGLFTEVWSDVEVRLEALVAFGLRTGCTRQPNTGTQHAKFLFYCSTPSFYHILLLNTIFASSFSQI